jgi:hypothetical protein
MFKVGDTITRNLCGARMELLITEVAETSIFCGPWEFCKKTGLEIDDCLEWGPEYGRSGSYIEEITRE